MRHLPDVLTSMIDAIPESEAGLRASLGVCLSSALYTAPEVMVNRWHQVVAILQEECDPTTDWGAEVARIFRGDEGQPDITELRRRLRQAQIDRDDAKELLGTAEQDHLAADKMCAYLREEIDKATGEPA